MTSIMSPTADVNPAKALPPPPPAADTEAETSTLQAEGVQLGEQEMKKLAEMAAERDA